LLRWHADRLRIEKDQSAQQCRRSRPCRERQPRARSRTFTVNVGDRIFFDTDSSVIRADAASTLDRQAQWLNQYPNYQITVEGHADERGTREYNLALGARRAAATRQYLSSRGVAANRINTISFGKERPVAVCDDISCWSQNRRAVTVLGGAGS
jgi:peptidoglycan-associated lipoprotein